MAWFNAYLQSCITALDPLDWVALLVVLMVVYSFYRAHKNQSMKYFNLFDLLMENGRVSRIACVFWGTWIVYTWAVVKSVLKGDYSLLTMYGTVFAIPLVARMFAPPPPPKLPEV